MIPPALLFLQMMTLPQPIDPPFRTLSCRNDSVAVSQVRSVAAGIIAADNDRALDRVLDYYANDAMLLPPNEPPVAGLDAIKPRYQALFSHFDPSIEGRIDEVCVSGTLAFVRGHNGGRLHARDGGQDRELDDLYLMLLQRESDGLWRISRLIWHRASPVSAPP
jgi:uncharacterized protein (TIGR02246 family)